MTPEQLTGLAALLLEFRDWVADYGPDTPLDVELINFLIHEIGICRQQLVQDTQ